MDIFAYLIEHRIAYERIDHPAVFTCEQAERLVPPGPGAKTKNLLLRDDKGRRHFLVSVGYEKSVDLKALTHLLKVRKLGFASPARLRRYLGVEPGAVTLLGLVNDENREVEVIIDEALWAHDALRCHPLVNTSTVVISRENLERFFETTGHQIQVLHVPGRVLDREPGTA